MGKSSGGSRELKRDKLESYAMRTDRVFSLQPLPAHPLFEIKLNQGNYKNTEEKNYSSGGGIAIFSLFHHCVSDVINNGIEIIVRSRLAVEKRIKLAENLKTSNCVYNANKENCW